MTVDTLAHLPDAVREHTAPGEVSKKRLREQFIGLADRSARHSATFVSVR
ncbi:MAG: hypothetical protein R2712_07500 [Vicinamibacterales bacterium]